MEFLEESPVKQMVVRVFVAVIVGLFPTLSSGILVPFFAFDLLHCIFSYKDLFHRSVCSYD